MRWLLSRVGAGAERSARRRDLIGPGTLSALGDIRVGSNHLLPAAPSSPPPTHSPPLPSPAPAQHQALEEQCCWHTALIVDLFLVPFRHADFCARPGTLGYRH